MKWFKRKKNKYEGMDRHKVGGHVFYTWPSPLKAPYRRQMAFFQALNDNSLSIGEADLKAAISLLEASINKGDIVRAGQIIGIMRDFSNLYASWRNMYRIGAAVILIKSEPIHEMQPHWMKLKQEIIEGNEEVRAFFLTTTWDILGKLKLSRQPTPPSDYLRSHAVVETERLFLSLIRPNTSKKALPD